MAATRPDQAGPTPARPETIEELFTALESPLLSYALRLAGERGVAEDLVQDAFMKLHAQFAEVREPRRWLYRTVHNAALNHRRNRAKVVSLTPDPHSSPEPHSSYSPEISDDAPLPDEQIARLEGIGLVRLSLEAMTRAVAS